MILYYLYLIYFQMENAKAGENEKTTKESDRDKFMRSVKNILAVEQETGKKEIRWREVSDSLRKLRSKRDKIDADNSEFLTRISELELKSPDLSIDEFKEICYDKFMLAKNQELRKETCHEIAHLIKEDKQIESELWSKYNTFKTFAYMKQQLVSKLNVKIIKK